MIIAYLVQARCIDQLDKCRVLLFQLFPVRQALYKVPFCQNSKCYKRNIDADHFDDRRLTFFWRHHLVDQFVEYVVVPHIQRERFHVAFLGHL
jgi:hypothetical protein